MTSARSSFFAAALADPHAIAVRHPEIFRIDWATRAKVVGTVVVSFGIAAAAVVFLDIEWQRVLTGFTRLGRFVAVMLPPTYGDTDKLVLYLHAMLETIAIAFLGTLLASVLALPFGFLAARNVVAQKLIHFVTRRGLDAIRSVDKLIWALIWINVVGLGPFAGVLAIMTSDFGLFGKLFSEAIEAADQKASEGVVSSGGGHLHRVRFGLLPGVLPVLIGQVLYQMESNTRSATIIGIVGAGGIGAHFQEQIRLNEWQHVAFLTLLMLITVAVIDYVSTKVRFAIIGTDKLNATH
ncbi:MAG: phosphonate ABC transporter, permease protein PhnE [Ancalomicrobiaceae bacterium]|nr:phosphonate ABC transporter, permease protein PhnE [Ancalomicrobiaceae bacterium]